MAVRLTGALDVAALEAALGDLVARHESLRTVFPDTLGVPRQQILDASAARPRLAVTAVSEASLPDGAGGGGAAGLRSCGRACRCGRICSRSGASEHVLLLLLHHIAGDGWSLAPLARDLARAYAARRDGQAPDAAGAAGAICRLHAVAARGAGRGERSAQRDRAPAGVLDRDAQGASRPARSAERPAAAGGVELSRRQRAARARRRSCTARLLALAREGRASLFMVLQAGARGAADAAGGRQRHPDRQPDRGPHRQRARRSDRLLRQHAGAAHRHVGQSELPRADRAGAGDQSGGLQPPGPAVRAAGGGAQPGALAVAASAVPGDAGVPEQRAGELRRSCPG